MVFIAFKREVRINERIRVPQIRVIGADGQQVGVMPTKEALDVARGQNLDLVEVSPDAAPPVCRIMDFGKYKYEQSKRERKAKKKQHVMHVKEVKLRLKIEDHDYQFKVSHARKFLEGHDKVKFTVVLRGRELDRIDSGKKLLARVAADLGPSGQIELAPKKEQADILKQRSELFKRLGRKEEAVADLSEYAASPSAHRGSRAVSKVIGVELEHGADASIRKEIAGLQRELAQEGALKVVGYCRRCKEALELDEGGLSERAKRRARELARDADLRIRAPRGPSTRCLRWPLAGSA